MKVEPKRRVLGRGLSSLIPETAIPMPSDAMPGQEGNAENQAQGIPVQIPVEQIRPNPHQPRREFIEDEIEALADSIRQTGILQPLLVRPEKGGSFTLIAGERRLRAAKRCGLQSIPAVIRHDPDDQLLLLALVENIQRDDLGPLETAQAFRMLVRQFGLTQTEVAERVGKPRSTVANFLRLLDLPDSVQQCLAAGQLDMGHGRALAGLDDPELIEQIGLAAAKGGWSVRKVEDQVKRAIVAGDHRQLEDDRRDPNVIAAEQTLSRALEAVVGIQTGRSGRGKIEISFSSEEDLDRLYRTLLRVSGKPVS